MWLSSLCYLLKPQPGECRKGRLSISPQTQIEPRQMCCRDVQAIQVKHEALYARFRGTLSCGKTHWRLWHSWWTSLAKWTEGLQTILPFLKGRNSLHLLFKATIRYVQYEFPEPGGFLGVCQLLLHFLPSPTKWTFKHLKQPIAGFRGILQSLSRGSSRTSFEIFTRQIAGPLRKGINQSAIGILPANWLGILYSIVQPCCNYE